jgi:hypothetical protein
VAAHLHIEEEDVGASRLDEAEELLGSRGGANIVPLGLEQAAEVLAEVGVVIEGDNGERDGLGMLGVLAQAFGSCVFGASFRASRP